MSRLTTGLLTSLSIRLCLLVSNWPHLRFLRLRVSTSTILGKSTITVYRPQSHTWLKFIFYFWDLWSQNPLRGVKGLKIQVLEVVQEWHFWPFFEGYEDRSPVLLFRKFHYFIQIYFDSRFKKKIYISILFFSVKLCFKKYENFYGIYPKIFPLYKSCLYCFLLTELSISCKCLVILLSRWSYLILFLQEFLSMFTSCISLKHK